VISKRIAQAVVKCSLWCCLMAVTPFSGSYSLFAQGTALGGHLGDEGISGGPIHRQLCFATADCGNLDRIGQVGTAPISIGSFTLSPQNAPTWSWMTVAPAQE